MTAKKENRQIVPEQSGSPIEMYEKVVAQSTEPDSSGFAPAPLPPVYFGDIDSVLRKLADNVPIVDTERIYLWEIDTQRRVYLALMGLGLVMATFGVLYSIVP